MNGNYIITVGRQLGSGGRVVAEELARRFNIAFYDKELIQKASRQSGLDSSFFEKTDEKVTTSLATGAIYDFFQENYFSSESLFQIQSDVIRNIAQTESAVIIGRCADYILRDHPRSVNIFVAANMQDRIERVAKYYKVSTEKALSLVEKTDKKRASFYNYYSNKVWGAAKSYDFCINSSALGLEATIDLTLDFVSKKLKTD